MVRAVGLAGCVATLVANGSVEAENFRRPTPAESQLFDWSGWYVGGHSAAVAGVSDWTANPPGVAAFNGHTDVSQGFNLFKGSGSLTGGAQGGYNVALPSRVMFGLETDISFPNSISGTSLASIGAASYDNTVLHLGTVRGRAGYVLNSSWLVYGTGGFAWSYDQLKRTALAGPLTDSEQSAFLWRFGWTAGAGVEIPVAPDWSARLEYLYSGFDGGSKIFPVTRDVFNSDLTLQQIRLGLNYKLFNGAPHDDGALIAKVPTAFKEDIWAVHGQTTFVEQYAAPFRATYRGQNSLGPNQGRETFDATAYLGLRPWHGAEIWINPEIDQGFGLSGTLGVAGFPSGEAYKKGADHPYTRLHRAFIRQTIDLGGETQKIDAAINQFAMNQTADRLVLTAGKFSVGDIFDTNKYAHDPRSDFLNWSIIDAGTFDYAAEAWGYTFGAAAEWYHGVWALRGGVFDMSTVPNSTDLDPRFGQFQWIGEIEHRHELFGQPGKIALTGYLSRGRMGTFQDAIQLSQIAGGAADIAAVRQYRSRSGLHVNVEQQLASDVGFFARAGIANGNVEPYEFTDIDRTLSAGLSVNGTSWGRPDDVFGIAGVANGITSVHQQFLNVGGLGILVGDGQLPHPGTEHIFETFYSLPVSFSRVTLDYQLIANPGYNRDRGLVSILATRWHVQF